jgi:hypothetical protein
MDFYAADGDFVNPLPFHGMSQYPDAPEQYPKDSVHVEDMLNYDSRFFSGAPAPSYRFEYPTEKPRRQER